MKNVSIKKGNKLIAKNVKVFETSEDVSRGLMFAKSGTVILTAKGEGQWSTFIHTFFCVPLLIAWINSKNVVVEVKQTKPWNFYFPKEPARYVFETSKLDTKIKKGDKIKIVSQKRS